MKEEIRDALEKATSGPWKVWERSDRVQVVEKDGELSICDMDGGDWKTWLNNAQLIANAPEWLRWQNERIDQLEKAMRDAIEEETNWNNPINALTCVISILEEALGKEE